MKRIFAFLLIITLLLSPMSLQAADTGGISPVSGTGVVSTKSSLNVRSGPGQDYDKIAVLKDGDTVEITGLSDNGWYEIVVSDTKGYVYGDYLKADITREQEKEEPEEKEIGEPEEGYRGSRLSPVMFRTLIAVVAILVIVVLMIITLRRIFQNDGEEDFDTDPDRVPRDPNRDSVPPYEDEGDEQYDEDGNPIYYEDEYDENGNPIYYEQEYDEDGNPIYYEDEYDENGNPIYYEQEYDEDGNPIYYEEEYDENGNPIYYEDEYDEDGNPVYYEDEDQEGDDYDPYRIKIDSSFFDDENTIEQPDAVTGYLERKKVLEQLVNDASDGGKGLYNDDGEPLSEAEKEARLEEALRKLDEIKQEISKLR